MEQAVDAALLCFENQHNCCQSVLAALCERYGLDVSLAIRLATGFGGGMGRGGTCGAVTGAVMLLGLVGGGGGPQCGAAKSVTRARVQDFYSRFIERHGSLICRDLLGLDLSTPEGRARAREEKVFTTVCPQFVSDAVRLVEAIVAAIPQPSH